MKTIETERLILRPISESDALDLFEYCRSPNVGTNAGWKPHDSIEETREIMKTIFLGQEGVFGVILKETGKLFGTIGLLPDPKRQNDKAMMLGYAISEDYWGNGYATEASRAVMDFGLSELELNVISAYCYPYNQRSRRVIEKCGFEYEGRLRRAEKRFDGEVLDNECFSMVRE